MTGGLPPPRVVVFAKAPVSGRVKTRLAAAIGAPAALAFYLETLQGLIGRLAGASGWRTVLAVAPDEALDHPAFAGWPVERAPQGDGDLGDRMGRFLAQARADAPVLIVGSDVPQLGRPHIEAALDALQGAPLVLGPSPDGGYWLIGASAPPPAGLFSGVRWSSAHALADTLANAGPGARLIDTLEDVDDEDSWRRHLARAGG